MKGPSLPPNFVRRKSSSSEDGDDNDNDSVNPNADPKRRRVEGVGPVGPAQAGPCVDGGSGGVIGEDDDDDDDIFVGRSVFDKKAMLATLARAAKSDEKAAAPKREEWMLEIGAEPVLTANDAVVQRGFRTREKAEKDATWFKSPDGTPAAPKPKDIAIAYPHTITFFFFLILNHLLTLLCHYFILNQGNNAKCP